MARRMLILDTPQGDLRQLTEAFRLADEGGEVEVVTTLEGLLARLNDGVAWDLVVLDYLTGDGSRGGGEAMAAIRAADADVPVIAVADHGSVPLAAEAVAAGVTDFLVRGGQLEARVSTLMGKVRKMLDLIDRNRVLRRQNELLAGQDQRRYRVIWRSPQMADVMARVERVAKIPRPVLIVGERGTGKELIARAIHAAGGNPAGPFVAVNCAALSDTLLESELFGHERGAFTGADATVPGKFEQADGGSLFLDEIGHMPLPFQQKILRVVEYGTFTRVGGTRELRVHARILAATNADLAGRIAAGEFLQDLYDRLSFEVVRVPPLRERPADIEALARHFLDEFMREIPALRGKHLTTSAIDMLKACPLPGNVRELKNIIERAAYRDTTNDVGPEDIGPLPGASPCHAAGSFEEQVSACRRQLIVDALARADGNAAQAARTLGLPYHRFRYYRAKCAPES